jgi:hypothetical protein
MHYENLASIADVRDLATLTTEAVDGPVGGRAGD